MDYGGCGEDGDAGCVGGAGGAGGCSISDYDGVPKPVRCLGFCTDLCCCCLSPFAPFAPFVFVSVSVFVLALFVCASPGWVNRVRRVHTRLIRHIEGQPG